MAIPENPITRKEQFLAKAAGESVNTPEPITREEMYLDAIASGSGGGGGGDNRFVVTLTPTAADYSGTMDKTSEEIASAFESGKNVLFYLGGVGYLAATIFLDTVTGAFFELSGKLVYVYTEPETNNYSTAIYPLGG